MFDFGNDETESPIRRPKGLSRLLLLRVEKLLLYPLIDAYLQVIETSPYRAPCLLSSRLLKPLREVGNISHRSEGATHLVVPAIISTVQHPDCKKVHLPSPNSRAPDSEVSLNVQPFLHEF